MSLTDREIDLIRSSFAIVSRDRMRAGGLFYDTLFRIAPETKPLFVHDLREQATKLLNTLGIVVSQLHVFGALAPVVEDLAMRHVAYGVKPEHYAQVGAALLEMLERILGDESSPEIIAAWTKAYGALSTTMIDAAYTHHAPEAQLARG